MAKTTQHKPRFRWTLQKLQDKLTAEGRNIDVLTHNPQPYTVFLKTKEVFLCECYRGHINKATIERLSRSNCCRRCKHLDQTRSFEEIKAEIEAKEELLVISTKNTYKDRRSVLTLKCLHKGHITHSTACDKLQGYGCITCHLEKQGTTYTTLKKHIDAQGKYTLMTPETQFNTLMDTDVQLRCKKHNYVWTIGAYAAYTDTTSCKLCRKENTILPYLNMKQKIERTKNVILLTTEKEYIDTGSIITVKCRNDGHIWSLPAHKLLYNKTRGCKICKQRSALGWYTPKRAQKNSMAWKALTAQVYFIKCMDKNEIFYKIGITTKDVQSRFSQESKMPYTIEILHTINTNLYEACFLEKYLHRKNKQYRYTPKQSFHGYTECFSSLTKVLYL